MRRVKKYIKKIQHKNSLDIGTIDSLILKEELLLTKISSSPLILKNYNLKKNNFLNSLAKDFTAKKNFLVSFDDLVKYINEYQERGEDSLTYSELELIPGFTLLSLIMKLNALIDIEEKELITKKKALRLKDLVLEKRTNDPYYNLKDILRDEYEEEKNLANYLANIDEEFFLYYHERFSKNLESLKGYLNLKKQEKVENIRFLNNLFISFENLSDFDLDKFYEKTSKVEEELNKRYLFSKFNQLSKEAFRVYLKDINKKEFLILIKENKLLTYIEKKALIDKRFSKEKFMMDLTEEELSKVLVIVPLNLEDKNIDNFEIKIKSLLENDKLNFLFLGIPPKGNQRYSDLDEKYYKQLDSFVKNKSSRINYLQLKRIYNENSQIFEPIIDSFKQICFINNYLRDKLSPGEKNKYIYNNEQKTFNDFSYILYFDKEVDLSSEVILEMINYLKHPFNKEKFLNYKMFSKKTFEKNIYLFNAEALDELDFKKSFQLFIPFKFSRNPRKALEKGLKDEKKTNKEVFELIGINNYRKEITSLTNGKYSLIIDSSGRSISYFEKFLLNSDSFFNLLDKGTFLKISDGKTTWSNTLYPFFKEPDSYESLLNLNRALFKRQDKKILVTTSITIALDRGVEIRKVSLTNFRKEEVNLNLESEVNPSLKILEEPDLALFKSKLKINKSGQILYIKENFDNREKLYYAHTMFINDPDVSLEFSKNSLEEELFEPKMSIKTSILLKPGETKTIYLLFGAGNIKSKLLENINLLRNSYELEGTRKVSSLLNKEFVSDFLYNFECKNIYLNLLNKLFTDKEKISRGRILVNGNSKNDSPLIKFGIEGNLPLIIFNIEKVKNLEDLLMFMNAYSYLKENNLAVNFLIIDSEKERYRLIIKKSIDNELMFLEAKMDYRKVQGELYYILKEELTFDDEILLKTLSKIVIDEKNINSFKKLIAKDKFKPSFENVPILNKNEICSNVIANIDGSLGSIKLSNGLGYTYFYNSSLFPLTFEEGFYLNNKKIFFDDFDFDFGINSFSKNDETFTFKEEEFIFLNGTVKVFLAKVKNLKMDSDSHSLTFKINPLFGGKSYNNYEYLLSEFVEEDNALFIRNVFDQSFNHVVSFITSSEKIVKKDSSSITILFDLKKGETKEIVFFLGTSENIFEISKEIKEHKEQYKTYLKNANAYWKKISRTVELNSDCKLFNEAFPWLLYQLELGIITNSGNNLLDGMSFFDKDLIRGKSLDLIDSNVLKKVILKQAKNHFSEGDILLVTKSENEAIRSKRNYIFVWLIYALNQYLETSKDFKILEEELPFASGQLIPSWLEERTGEYYKTKTQATLLKHVEMSLQYVLKEKSEDLLTEKNLFLYGALAKAEDYFEDETLLLKIKDFQKDIRNAADKNELALNQTFIYYVLLLNSNLIDEKMKLDIVDYIEEELVDDDQKIIKNMEFDSSWISLLPEEELSEKYNINYFISLYIRVLFRLDMKDLAYKYFKWVYDLEKTHLVFDYNFLEDINFQSWNGVSSYLIYEIILSDIFGLKRVQNNLFIKPMFPHGFKGTKLTLNYGGKRQVIKYKKSNKNRILVDRKESKYVDLTKTHKTITVEYKE